MKSAIVYYSYSGNTRKVAQVLAGYLGQRGEVEIIELKGLDESDNFFKQVARAFVHKRAKIEPANFDLSGYDLVCFGTPVWAFGPAPAINAYLEKCTGLGNKSVVLFATYGSGTGRGKCLDYMQNSLAQKGAGNFRRFSIRQFKVNNPDFIRKVLAQAKL